MINFIKINKILLIILIFTINLLIIFKEVNGVENKIIFKINDKAYTSLDYEKRIKYLDFVGNNENLNKEIILNDFISANIFFEYYIRTNNISDYTTKINEIYNNILEINRNNNKKYKYKINKSNILFNIEIDYVRKTILENILNSNINELNTSKEEIDLLYKFDIKYINFNIKDNLELLKEINNLKNINIKKIIEFLNVNNVEYFIKANEIKDINKVDGRIKKNLLLNNNFFILKENSNITLIFIEKMFETLEGIVVNLYSVKSQNKIDENFLLCENLLNIKNNPNIVNKEYRFKDLNNKLKNNLLNINDYIKFNNEDGDNIYIILCNIKFDIEKLNSVSINKLIDSNVSDIEEKFINKYSKVYNLVKIN